ncbi:hypothetical protein [Staphylococcus phage vB_ScaM-V1SC04]|nr:hypothetical protein [Staphylococcus phage vB_ScaM-V1SC04]
MVIGILSYLDTEWKDTTIRSLRSDTKPLPGNIRYLSYVRLTKPLCVTKNTFSC